MWDYKWTKEGLLSQRNNLCFWSWLVSHYHKTIQSCYELQHVQCMSWFMFGLKCQHFISNHTKYQQLCIWDCGIPTQYLILHYYSNSLYRRFRVSVTQAKELWKCGNLEMCFHCLSQHVTTVEASVKMCLEWFPNKIGSLAHGNNDLYY